MKIVNTFPDENISFLKIYPNETFFFCWRFSYHLQQIYNLLTILLGDEIILLLKGFGNEINLSLLIIDDFWDKFWLFSMTTS